ncbi:uncharacterized protein [Physcomitrium patens]|uniref:Uncharacterized protein n=1 Tax=Physcomitrium patens TaxID=3218 RepID=A0A2K1KMS6_PHYPA|nr:hypothetical protein PHYPA_005976 [Physcomitrium patens]
MVADICVGPYDYKLIMGTWNVGTQIMHLRRKRKETKPSRLLHLGDLVLRVLLEATGHMDIWDALNEILTFSLEEDRWSTHNLSQHISDRDFRASGVGKGIYPPPLRLFKNVFPVQMRSNHI